MEEEQRATSSSSYGMKLVPWMSWDEWLFVYNSLFSHSPLSVASALTRISTWRSRGCVPVTVEVTASIIEIQQRDSELRKVWAVDDSGDDQANQCADDPLSAEMLAMLYCMAIMRLVNGVVEKTRKQREVSIAVAADAIGLPRMLIDIRHEGSHRELPALQVVRSAAAKALDWLISYYWEPQKKAIPFQGDSTTKIRKGIESKLHELVTCLKVKETSQLSSPSSLKGKRNKKQVMKILNSLVAFYSSCSSEVVLVLLDFLLKAINSPDSMEPSAEPAIEYSTDALLDDWKPVVKKILHKEPELVVDLLRAILDKIEIQENIKYETGRDNLKYVDNPEVQQVEHLSSLFAWLIRNLKQLKPRQRKDSSAETKSSSPGPIVPKVILTQLLRKCLMLSAFGNKLLMNSTFHIVQLIGEDHLMKKLNKLSSLVSSNLVIISHNELSLTDSKNLTIGQEESISHAAKKLKSIICFSKKRKAANATTDGDIVNSRRWVVATSWNPCPIGMLPNSAGSSGCLPVLECRDGPIKIPDTLHRRKNVEPPTYAVSELDEPSFKRGRAAIEGDYVYEGSKDDSVSSGLDCKLMIGGVWSEVAEEDLLAVKSSVVMLA